LIVAKKRRTLSEREKRKVRLQQVLFAAIAILVIASFVVTTIQ
jgi:hypothetical protein